MKKWILIGLLAWAVSAVWPVSSGYASGPDTQVDALIAKLIEKGILTKEEAEGLKGQIASDAKTIRDNNMKTGLPDWVQNTKVGGDMRVRYQTTRRKDATNNPQSSLGRLRARLNVETKINDKAKVVIGIASDGGSGNPRSNNLTFSGTTTVPNQKTYVVLNKAYGQYMPTDHLTLTGGKMDNPIWEPMEFLWDADITPEGTAVQYNYKVNDKISLFTTGTFFVLDNYTANSSTSHPYQWISQSGVNAKLGEKVDAKMVFTYTGFANIRAGFGGTKSRSSPTTNTAGSNGGNTLQYDYSAPMGSAEIGFNDPFGELLPSPLSIPRVGIFGEYTKNGNAPDKNIAWMAGGYMGNSKVNGFKTWKGTMAYKYIGQDAVMDIFPDSDFYGGATDVKGIEGILEIGLAKNMSMVFDYYSTQRIKAIKAQEHLFQADINWKF